MDVYLEVVRRGVKERSCSVFVNSVNNDIKR